MRVTRVECKDNLYLLQSLEIIELVSLLYAIVSSTRESHHNSILNTSSSSPFSSSRSSTPPLSSAASFNIGDFPCYVSSTMHIYRPTQAVDYFVKPILNHPKISRFAVFDVSVTPQMYALFFFQSHSQHLTATTDTAALHAWVLCILCYPNTSCFFFSALTIDVDSERYDIANEASFLKAVDLISFIDSYNPVVEKCVVLIANNCSTTKRYSPFYHIPPSPLSPPSFPSFPSSPSFFSFPSFSSHIILSY